MATDVFSGSRPPVEKLYSALSELQTVGYRLLSGVGRIRHQRQCRDREPTEADLQSLDGPGLPDRPSQWAVLLWQAKHTLSDWLCAGLESLSWIGQLPAEATADRWHVRLRTLLHELQRDVPFRRPDKSTSRYVWHFVYHLPREDDMRARLDQLDEFLGILYGNIMALDDPKPLPRHTPKKEKPPTGQMTKLLTFLNDKDGSQGRYDDACEAGLAASAEAARGALCRARRDYPNLIERKYPNLKRDGRDKNHTITNGRKKNLSTDV